MRFRTRFVPVQGKWRNSGSRCRELFSRVHSRYESLHDDLRYGVEDALESFRSSVNAQVDQFARLAVAGA